MRYLIIITTSFLFACNNNKTEPDKEIVISADSSKREPGLTGGEINNSDSQAVVMSVSTLPVSGDLGQVTFTRNDSTIFYFRTKERKGVIRINQQEYIVNRMSFVKMTNMYRFSGNDVRIDAKGAIFRENKGEDCAYGLLPEVTIRLGRSFLKLKDIQVQDCPAN